MCSERISGGIPVNPLIDLQIHRAERFPISLCNVPGKNIVHGQCFIDSDDLRAEIAGFHADHIPEMLKVA